MGQLELFDSGESRGDLFSLLKENPEKLESHLKKRGYSRIIGIDEAGRGPLAGPVVSCACLLPSSISIPGLTDSKLLSERQIEDLYHCLTETSGVEYGIAVVGPEVIDAINILQATMQAMREAAQKIEAEIAIVDGTKDPALSIPTLCLAKADRLCQSVSAASIIAKYSRDKLMRSYHEKWPEYGFLSNKGYGTAYHREQLECLGPSPIHRRSFAPLREASSQEAPLQEEIGELQMELL